jgi:hypothetical protein
VTRRHRHRYALRAASDSSTLTQQARDSFIANAIARRAPPEMRNNRAGRRGPAHQRGRTGARSQATVRRVGPLSGCLLRGSSLAIGSPRAREHSATLPSPPMQPPPRRRPCAAPQAKATASQARRSRSKRKRAVSVRAIANWGLRRPLQHDRTWANSQPNRGPDPGPIGTIAWAPNGSSVSTADARMGRRSRRGRLGTGPCCRPWWRTKAE